MDIILLERVENLGQMGEIVSVKPGYARNFLLPQGKALRANEQNKAYFEAKRQDIEADNLAKKKDAEGTAKLLEGKRVVLLRQAGDSGQLYGSVSARDVAQALAEDGVKVTRQQVSLTAPIKTLGLHGVRVVLHPEVDVLIETNVARTADEAELQAQGIDVTAEMFDDEELAEDAREELGLNEADAEDAAEEPAEDADTAEDAEPTA
ncbi:MAG: 50S ribosomal protein L9 [Sphingomonadales bacterium]